MKARSRISILATAAVLTAGGAYAQSERPFPTGRASIDAANDPSHLAPFAVREPVNPSAAAAATNTPCAAKNPCAAKKPAAAKNPCAAKPGK